LPNSRYRKHFANIKILILSFCELRRLESSLIVGALIFTMRGIGKSTPTIKASPSAYIGRKKRIFHSAAADAALSTAFLFCSLINL